MKILTSKWLNVILWVAFLIPYSLWLYIWLFIGIANSNIDDICFTLSIALLVIIVIKKTILSIITENEQ